MRPPASVSLPCDALRLLLTTTPGCFQLTLLGVRVLIARLHVSTPQYEVGGKSNEHGSYSLAVSVIDDFVLFLEELQPDSDYNGFWFPREYTDVDVHTSQRSSCSCSLIACRLLFPHDGNLCLVTPCDQEDGSTPVAEHELGFGFGTRLSPPRRRRQARQATGRYHVGGQGAASMGGRRDGDDILGGHLAVH
jgi:hypothetical protein